MLATVGFFFPAIFHWPGGGEPALAASLSPPPLSLPPPPTLSPPSALGVPEDAYANLNPYGALKSVPEGALWQIAVAIFGVELQRIKRTIKGDKVRERGGRRRYFSLSRSLLFIAAPHLSHTPSLPPTARTPAILAWARRASTPSTSTTPRRSTSRSRCRRSSTAASRCLASSA